MKTAKIHVLALAVSLSLACAFAARPAAAQCIPDPPTGSIVIRNCGDLTSRSAPTEPVATVANVPLSIFAGNPIVATLSWMAARSLASATQRVALKPNGRAGVVLRGGRTLRQVSW